MSQYLTTDAIKIQLQNLIRCHNYKTVIKLHNPTEHQAYLDREEITFTASSDKQNVFVVLTKSTEVLALMLEIITTDLDENTSGSNTMFLQCTQFDACGLE